MNTWIEAFPVAKGTGKYGARRGTTRNKARFEGLIALEGFEGGDQKARTSETGDERPWHLGTVSASDAQTQPRPTLGQIAARFQRGKVSPGAAGAAAVVRD